MHGMRFWLIAIALYLFRFAVGVFEKFCSEPLCNRAGLAVADDTAVNFNNADDLGGGSGKEKLIRDIQVKSRKIPFNNRNIFLLCQFYYDACA